MENEKGINSDDLKQFNKIEVEIKEAIKETDEMLDEAVKHLIEEEGDLRYILEMNESEKEDEIDHRYSEATVESARSRIESTNALIEELKKDQQRTRELLERYYKVDQRIDDTLGPERP